MHLVRLNLAKTKVTDAGLVHLAKLTSLTVLDLNGTEITDAGLEHLKRLWLRRLDVRDTRVTEAGAQMLEQAMPGQAMPRAAVVR